MSNSGITTHSLSERTHVLLWLHHQQYGSIEKELSEGLWSLWIVFIEGIVERVEREIRITYGFSLRFLLIGVFVRSESEVYYLSIGGHQKYVQLGIGNQ